MFPTKNHSEEIERERERERGERKRRENRLPPRESMSSISIDIHFVIHRPSIQNDIGQTVQNGYSKALKVHIWGSPHRVIVILMRFVLPPTPGPMGPWPWAPQAHGAQGPWGHGPPGPLGPRGHGPPGLVGPGSPGAMAPPGPWGPRWK